MQYLGKNIDTMTDAEILDASAAIARQRSAFNARVQQASSQKAALIAKERSEPGAGFLALEKAIADKKAERGL